MPKKRTDDSVTISEVLNKAEVIWLALADEDGPHCVPVNFALEDNTLFVHSGKKGRKAACLDSGAKLAFSTAVDMALRPSDVDACELGYHFRSVMGQGIPRKLDGSEKMHGLDLLTLKYAGKAMPYNEKVLAITQVYAINITSATARIK